MDTKGFLGVLLLISLIAAFMGCGGAPDDNTPPVTPPAEEIPEQEPVEPEPAKPELSQEVSDLLAKTAKITVYEYAYQNTESVKLTAKHYVSGSKMRIKYDSSQDYNKFKYYDIYLDKSKGLAYLVCGDTYECKGIKGKEVLFDQFNVETPLETVAKIDNGMKIEETEWDSKKTALVSYTNNDGDPENVWLWIFTGMPVKREITRGDTKVVITYNKMVIDPAQVTSVELPAGLEMS